jgi:hypothetical protein
MMAPPIARRSKDFAKLSNVASVLDRATVASTTPADNILRLTPFRANVAKRVVSTPVKFTSVVTLEVLERKLLQEPKSTSRFDQGSISWRKS